MEGNTRNYNKLHPNVANSVHHLFSAVLIVVFEAGLGTALTNATIQYDNSNYTAPVSFALPAGKIMNVSAINEGFTTENKLVTVYDASGLASQQITFIISPNLVSIVAMGRCDSYVA